MSPIYQSRAYETWAPFVARVILAFQFGLAALFKILMHAGEVAQTAMVGVPFPEVAVWLAFVLEVAGAVCLIVGYRVRLVAAVLAPYVLLLAVLFYHNFSDPMIMGMFVSHLGLIAALLYVSVYGAQRIAVRKDSLPA
jgi:putative oxidoreductase